MSAGQIWSFSPKENKFLRARRRCWLRHLNDLLETNEQLVSSENYFIYKAECRLFVRGRESEWMS
jgi:hypothetical protein